MTDRGDGSRRRAWWTVLIIGLIVLGSGLIAPAEEVTLYRIPTKSGKWFRYSDVRPPKNVFYREVGDFEHCFRPVILRSGRRKIHVYYPKGDQRAGRTIRDDAWYAVRLCERIAGFSFADPGDIKIYKVPEVEIGAAAQHKGRHGIMTSGSDHFLMYHEIAHYWMDFDLFADRWLAEGYAELYAYIVGKRTRGLREAEAFRLYKLRAVKDYDGDDFALEHWGHGEKTTLDRERFAYGKAFAVCAALLDRVGLHKLQQVNRTILRRKKPVTTRDYFGLLEAVARRKTLDDIFSGWIIAGPYRVKGKRVPLRDALRHAERYRPKVPTFLDPSIQANTSRPTTQPADRRPVGFFVDEHGNPIQPATTRPRS